MIQHIKDIRCLPALLSLILKMHHLFLCNCHLDWEWRVISGEFLPKQNFLKTTLEKKNCAFHQRSYFTVFLLWLSLESASWVPSLVLCLNLSGTINRANYKAELYPWPHMAWQVNCWLLILLKLILVCITNRKVEWKCVENCPRSISDSFHLVFCGMLQW